MRPTPLLSLGAKRVPEVMLFTLEIHNLVHPLRGDAKRACQIRDAFTCCVAQTNQLITTTRRGSPEAANLQQPGDDLGP